MNERWYVSVISLALCTALLTGCGRPPAQGGGPPDDYAVLSVVAAAQERDWTERIHLVGALEAVESIDVVSEVDARLLEIGFVEGDAVEKGALLFRFDDGRLKAYRDQAQAAFRLAEANRSRAEELLANQTISKQEYDQADAAFASAQAVLLASEEDLADAQIRAPFAGVMSARTVSVGQFVSRGARLASLVQVDPLDVVFNIPGRYAADIRIGAEVVFSPPSSSATSLDAELIYLAPRLDEQTRTLEAKARIGNPDGNLRPGLFGPVQLAMGEQARAVVIPAAAISFSSEGANVVVMGEDGRAEFRPVVPGRRQQDDVEIKEGLAAGERVVVEGHQKMGPGSRIQISEKSRRYGVEPPAAETTETAGEVAAEEGETP